MQPKAERNSPAALRTVGTVFVSLGLVALLIAAIFAIPELIAGGSAVKAEGTIVQFNQQQRYPRVRFTDRNGEAVEFVAGVRNTGWREGDRVPVIYDPANPRSARIDEFAGRWFFPGLAGIFAVTFGGTGLLLRLLAARWRRRTADVKQSGEVAKPQP